MSDLMNLMIASTATITVLSVVYVLSEDPRKQARALELIKLILSR